ncbi:hypothetical protein H2Y56_00265 [Pectobacterium aroidearum]|uniref:Uncharacterized protein n=1 Tax=Pectobacterium aroidearum TaxID=1201031 RepID=A0AAW3SPR7_9GAMM|nr:MULTISPECIES: hypothetical protein [Pectobacterium]MBA0203585.1 hypothetical protein [Pectobacterium aroidearum]MBA5197757.1 hypothetical protein [Pectobacterium aroidearum]MBA5202454.1 hypothetical protein [Pectobacterium aroidearum]MBA5230488.1 hypothetical protein [Pectobacterium aroidearum]MBA5230550.1 hypothetical protein [Pectobacterium aroidearum]
MRDEDNTFFYSANEKLFYIGGDLNFYPKDVIAVSEKEMLDIVEKNHNQEAK